MDVAATAELIECELHAAADAERAVNEKRYLKSELVHLGVPMAVIRRTAIGAVRPAKGAAVRPPRGAAPPERAEVLALVDRLWTPPPDTEPVHELRMAAIEVLVRWVRLLEAGDLTVAERLIRESHGWAYVDVVAAKVVGDLADRYPELWVVLDRWSADDDFWIRRSALLALLPGIRAGHGDLARLARYGDAMIGESEFFIRKALGWVLRELCKRDPGWVRDWVIARIDRVSGVTLREAVRYLPAAETETLLAAYRSRRAR